MNVNVPFKGYDYYDIDYSEEGLVFDDARGLVSIFGYQVGSQVKLRPDLLKVFRDYPFSEGFKELYHEGIFEVSEAQGHILHRNLRPDIFRLSLVMDDPGHRDEFLFFARESGFKITPGINSSPPFIIMLSTFLVQSFLDTPYQPIQVPF